MAWTKTKTIVVVGAAVLLAVGTPLAVKKVEQWRRAERLAERRAEVAGWKKNQWPEEREQEIERIKRGQQVNETVNATTIDLSPYINAKLTDAPACWKGNNNNNLLELPAGTHIYAGVPFDVSGSIQLDGGWLRNHYGKNYPARVNGIRIGRKCTRIYLFQGNSYVPLSNFGKVVAKLVIHYDNGSTRELDLVGGEQAFDFWCPLFKTGISPAYSHTAPGTERAWAGSNPYLKKWQPQLSLVLYRTTFQNPQPDVKIDSVDYVSAETMTCPFLVGLTVD